MSFANLKKESQPALLTFFNGRKVDEAWPKEGEKENDSPDLYLVPPPKQIETRMARSRSARARAVKATRPPCRNSPGAQAFADAVTRDNPLLARAMVNRVWAMLFGRGLVHPVDLMDSKHPPSHPELLDWLARDFERNGYDVKRLFAFSATRRISWTRAIPARVSARPVALPARASIIAIPRTRCGWAPPHRAHARSPRLGLVRPRARQAAFRGTALSFAACRHGQPA